MYTYLPYRIPFSETDSMGIVHHSNHARYLERGRVELLRLLDLNYQRLTEQGIHFPLTSMEMRFKRPLRFDDIIWVETTISEMGKTRLGFGYRILAGEDLREPFNQIKPIDAKALLEGSTEHCCVDNDGKPKAIRDDVVALLAKHFAPKEILR